MHGYQAIAVAIDGWSQRVALNILRPRCIDCRGRMWSSTIEPGDPGHDISTFECPRCQRQKSKVVKIGDKSATSVAKPKRG